MPQGQDKIALHVSTSKWGLPASDQRSLELILLFRMSGLSVDLVPSKYPYNSSTQSLPALYFEGRIVGYSDMHSLLRAVEGVRDMYEIPDAVMFAIAVRETLCYSVEREIWLVQSNFTAVSAPEYAKGVPFPVNAFLARQKRREMQNLLKQNGMYDEFSAFAIADDVLGRIEDKLRQREGTFIFNGKSVADAVVVSTLLIVLSMPLMTSPIAMRVKGSEILMGYLNGVIGEYMPDVVVEGLNSGKTGVDRPRSAETMESLFDLESFREMAHRRELLKFTRDCEEQETEKESILSPHESALNAKLNSVFIASVFALFTGYVVINHIG